jgi:hypothetical protein
LWLYGDHDRPGLDGAIVLDAIVEGKLPWSTVDEICRFVRLDREQVLDQLADLEAEGMIESWEDWPKGLAVTLTPLMARRMGVRIVERGIHEEPRWAEAHEPDPPKIALWFTLTDFFAGMDEPDLILEEIEDPTQDPVAAAIANEERPRLKWDRRSAFPSELKGERKKALQAKLTRKQRRAKRWGSRRTGTSEGSASR